MIDIHNQDSILVSEKSDATGDKTGYRVIFFLKKNFHVNEIRDWKEYFLHRAMAAERNFATLLVLKFWCDNTEQVRLSSEQKGLLLISGIWGWSIDYYKKDDEGTLRPRSQVPTGSFCKRDIITSSQWRARLQNRLWWVSFL